MAAKPTTSKESEKKTADDMAFRNTVVNTLDSMLKENKSMREAIEASKKTTKKKITRPEAAKIQGLQTLKNTLGTQKTS